MNARAPRVVALGGGTGLPILLRGLRSLLFPPEWKALPARGRDRLTAIVTVADEGGSSGRLREAYGILAPGDIRNCLLALSEGDPTLTAIFGFRFDGCGDVSGHSLGNLILTALSRIESHFPAAVERAGEILGARGRVLPSTGEGVRLEAEFEDGTRVVGESRIAAARRPIRRVRLRPDHTQPLPQARDAIASADLVVIGPGSLYTSLIPVLLVEGLAEALSRSPARIVLAMNLMSEPGETDGYSAVDHVRAIRRHAPGLPIHAVVLSSSSIPQARLQGYAAEGAFPVGADCQALRAMGLRPLARDLLALGPKVRHDPCRLAAAVLEAAGTPRAVAASREDRVWVRQSA